MTVTEDWLDAAIMELVGRGSLCLRGQVVLKTRAEIDPQRRFGITELDIALAFRRLEDQDAIKPYGAGGRPPIDQIKEFGHWLNEVRVGTQNIKVPPPPDFEPLETTSLKATLKKPSIGAVKPPRTWKELVKQLNQVFQTERLQRVRAIYQHLANGPCVSSANDGAIAQIARLVGMDDLNGLRAILLKLQRMKLLVIRKDGAGYRIEHIGLPVPLPSAERPAFEQALKQLRPVPSTPTNQGAERGSNQ